MARCYSGSATELVYHLSCLYTLSSTLDKIEKRASRSSKETVQTGEQLLIMMLRQVLTRCGV